MSELYRRDAKPVYGYNCRNDILPPYRFLLENTKYTWDRQLVAWPAWDLRDPAPIGMSPHSPTLPFPYSFAVQYPNGLGNSHSRTHTDTLYHHRHTG